MWLRLIDCSFLSNLLIAFRAHPNQWYKIKRGDKEGEAETEKTERRAPKQYKENESITFSNLESMSPLPSNETLAFKNC